jgi:hypothetical protein
MHSKIRVVLRAKSLVDEGRTLPVSAEFVNSIAEKYKEAYTRLIKGQLKETVDGCKQDIANSQAVLASMDDASEDEKLDFEAELKTAKKDIAKNKKALTAAMRILKMLGVTDKNIDDVDASFLNKLRKEVIIKSNPDASPRSMNVAELPIKTFLDYITELSIKDTIIKGRLTDEEIETKLKQLFKARNVDKVRFNIQMIKKGVEQTDYAGIYTARYQIIIITVDASMFMTSKAVDRAGNTVYMSAGISADTLAKDYKQVVDNIQTISEGFKTIIRHEIQHLAADAYQELLGTKYNFGMPKSKVYSKDFGKKYDELGIALDKNGKRMLDPQTGDYVMYIDPRTGNELAHHLTPVETSTNAQDAIDEFETLVAKYVFPDYAETLKDAASQRNYVDTINYLLKEYIGINANRGRPAMPAGDNIKGMLHRYVLVFKPNIYFMNLKSQNPQLWKWSASKLFDHMTNVVKSQIQQNKKDKK